MLPLHPRGVLLCASAPERQMETKWSWLKKSVWINAMSLHFDPEHYANPNVFDPEHFSKEARAKRNP